MTGETNFARSSRLRKVLYWIATGLLAAGMLSGGLAQLSGAQKSAEGIAHLGYPVYLMYILGFWKIAGVIAILIPGFKLLKEWAYAGFFFAMSGATLSHIAAGDTFSQALASFIFILLILISWYFRPAERKI
ncbi:DoxX family protein [Sphingobacterium spiritivorum]|uniref:DoxX family protein n=1 Tax=Sphingobacterium spiritivorum TaxID=258 RepID=UPI003DA6A599